MKSYFNKSYAFCSLFGLLLLLVAFAAPVCAEDEPKGLMDVKLDKKPSPLDTNVEASIDHLFKVLRDGATFDPSKVRPMLDFVTFTMEPKDIAPAKRFDGFGICLRRDVKTDLDQILRYFYNPEIPNYLLCPAVLRLSGWHEGSEILNRDKGLWDELPTLTDPVLVRGQEYESTTPDSFAEAYYLYDLNRLMILLKYGGRNVLISVTEQEDKSDVGRKGAILDDKEWDYFYSGLEGLNKGMIGWMDTFTYSSGSVQVYIEGMDRSETTVFLFKWLRAGWAGMNVAKRSHIYDGTLRYIRSFSKVVESDTLTPDKVVAAMADVSKLSKTEVDTLIKEYSVNFEKRFKDNAKLTGSDYSKIIADGRYYEVLDDKARMSVLSLEKLKGLLGMPTLVTLPETAVVEPDVVEVPVVETIAAEPLATESPDATVPVDEPLATETSAVESSVEAAPVAETPVDSEGIPGEAAIEATTEEAVPATSLVQPSDDTGVVQVETLPES